MDTDTPLNQMTERQLEQYYLDMDSPDIRQRCWERTIDSYDLLSQQRINILLEQRTIELLKRIEELEKRLSEK